MTHPRVLVLSVVAVLLGCHSPAEPLAGIALAVALQPVPAIVGQPLSIDVTVANNSPNEILVAGSAVGFAIVEVRNSRGDLVPDANPRICDAAAGQHRVAPSGTLIDRLSFSGLAAGVYRVRAEVGVVSRGVLWSPEYTVSVGVP